MASAVSLLDFDEGGLPVVQVKLYPSSAGHGPVPLRFLLDTGADWTIVDASVPAVLCRKSRKVIQAWDAVGTRRDLKTVLLKRLEVGGVGRDALVAMRMDLKSSLIGRGQDRPVDGVLGMNFLRGTRFLFDAKGKRVEWWPRPLSGGTTLSVIYSPEGSPGVPMRFGGETFPCLLDTCLMGGIDLPWRLRPEGKGERVHNFGVLGETRVEGVVLPHQRVETQAAVWRDVPVHFQKGNEQAGLGQDVWSAVPVCFDFLRHKLTWANPATEDLPMVQPGKRGIPVLWDRSGKVPFLKVVEVMPASAMERAGCKAEDRILRAGALEGRALNLRNLMALLAEDAPHTWLVQRGQSRVTLLFQPER